MITASAVSMAWSNKRTSASMTFVGLLRSEKVRRCIPTQCCNRANWIGRLGIICTRVSAVVMRVTRFFASETGMLMPGAAMDVPRVTYSVPLENCKKEGKPASAGRAKWAVVEPKEHRSHEGYS